MNRNELRARLYDFMRRSEPDLRVKGINDAGSLVSEEAHRRYVNFLVSSRILRDTGRIAWRPGWTPQQLLEATLRR